MGFAWINQQRGLGPARLAFGFPVPDIQHQDVHAGWEKPEKVPSM